ncbi:late embryogenesis abundant protein [Striga asiatica]|uniref:Late embryogenesis abundant protein n=1 Tax=Striga asiatica TaxID=4170 RepID=A0A5A7P856_STRAF|nr:late embryogenesis abundant protein [Striga asiatica]
MRRRVESGGGGNRGHAEGRFGGGVEEILELPELARFLSSWRSASAEERTSRHPLDMKDKAFSAVTMELLDPDDFTVGEADQASGGLKFIGSSNYFFSVFRSISRATANRKIEWRRIKFLRVRISTYHVRERQQPAASGKWRQSRRIVERNQAPLPRFVGFKNQHSINTIGDCSDVPFVLSSAQI